MREKITQYIRDVHFTGKGMRKWEGILIKLIMTTQTVRKWIMNKWAERMDEGL